MIPFLPHECTYHSATLVIDPHSPCVMEKVGALKLLFTNTKQPKENCDRGKTSYCNCLASLFHTQFIDVLTDLRTRQYILEISSLKHVQITINSFKMYFSLTYHKGEDEGFHRKKVLPVISAPSTTRRRRILLNL